MYAFCYYVFFRLQYSLFFTRWQNINYFFPITLSIINAIAPSPVTLQAVPKLSIAMYSAIISACADSSKPSMDCRMPSDAMMAPPGTPGAATIVMPSMKMKPANREKSWGMPCIIISARAHATIFNVLPDKWIVAQSGMTNPAMSAEAPFFRVCSSVTGIVAALD